TSPRSSNNHTPPRWRRQCAFHSSALKPGREPWTCPGRRAIMSSMEHPSAPPRSPPTLARPGLGLGAPGAACAALHAGCRDADRAAPGAPTGPAAAAERGRPTIELLDPGDEPRRRLRYQLVEGAEETLVMRMNLSIQTRADDIPIPEVETPPVEMTMR